MTASPPPSYPSGSTVPVTVVLPLVNGAVIVPTSVAYTITDDQLNVIDGPIEVDPSTITGSTFMISVDALDNTLPPTPPPPTGEISPGPMPINVGLRQITTTIGSAAGTFTDVQSWILRAAQPLTRMVNSFVTWPETILTRYMMTDLPGWDAATDDQRLGALQTAFNNMLQLRYRFPIGENYQSRIVDFYGMSVDNVFGRIYMVLADIAFYTETDFVGWPPIFQNVLKRAQMAEADWLLQGDPISLKRDSGIISESIGESKTTFNAIPEIRTPVSRAALKELTGYTDMALLIGRA